MDYTVSELNPGANDGWYEVQGLKVPLLNGNVMFDIDCDPTTQDAADYMKKALHDMRMHDRRIVDGDWFNTPIGKFMAQSPSILTEAEAQGRAAKIAAQQQQQVQQVTQQTVAPTTPNPNTVNLPNNVQNVKLNVNVYMPLTGPLSGTITVRSDMAHYNNYLISEVDKSIGQLGVALGSGFGNVLNVIDFPNGDKTMLVGYDNDAKKVVVEIRQ